MKIKGPLIIRTGPYQDWRPEVEVEVPDNLKGTELFRYLYKTYGDISEKQISDNLDKIQKHKQDFVEDLDES